MTNYPMTNHPMTNYPPSTTYPERKSGTVGRKQYFFLFLPTNTTDGENLS
jgi:hypothetical protein